MTPSDDALLRALDDIEEASGFRRGPACSVAKALQQMTPELAEKMRRVMRSDKVTAAALAQVLMAHGYDVRANAIARHRRPVGTGCACPEDFR